MYIHVYIRIYCTHAPTEKNRKRCRERDAQSPATTAFHQAHIYLFTVFVAVHVAHKYFPPYNLYIYISIFLISRRKRRGCTPSRHPALLCRFHAFSLPSLLPGFLVSIFFPPPALLRFMLSTAAPYSSCPRPSPSALHKPRPSTPSPGQQRQTTGIHAHMHMFGERCGACTPTRAERSPTVWQQQRARCHPTFPLGEEGDGSGGADVVHVGESESEFENEKAKRTERHSGRRSIKIKDKASRKAKRNTPTHTLTSQAETEGRRSRERGQRVTQ